MINERLVWFITNRLIKWTDAHYFSVGLNSANPLIEDEKLENQHGWGL